MRRLVAIACFLCVLAAPYVTAAQAATVLFDAASGTALADASAATSVLYVNGTAFPLVHQCSQSGTVVTCSALLPVVTAALTPSGAQSFQVAFVDPVFGETAKSVPFIKNRLAAPTNGRFQ